MGGPIIDEVTTHSPVWIPDKTTANKPMKGSKAKSTKLPQIESPIVRFCFHQSPTASPTPNSSPSSSRIPSLHQSELLSGLPSEMPTMQPSYRQTNALIVEYSQVPTTSPSKIPSMHPSYNPSLVSTECWVTFYHSSHTQLILFPNRATLHHRCHRIMRQALP